MSTPDEAYTEQTTESQVDAEQRNRIIAVLDEDGHIPDEPNALDNVLIPAFTFTLRMLERKLGLRSDQSPP